MYLNSLSQELRYGIRCVGLTSLLKLSFLKPMRSFALILMLSLFTTGCASSQQPYSSEPSPDKTIELLIKDNFPTKYDRDICKASKDFLPVPTSLYGCTLYKAQLYQESLLDPNARSPAGAVGIAQFMPRTWEEIINQMGLGIVERTNASVAIQAGAYYMMRLREGWTSERAEKDRMELSQASYNAGFGNILKAQKVCNDALSWDVIRTCLYKITGHHSKETNTYVDRIWMYWKKWYIT